MKKRMITAAAAGLGLFALIMIGLCLFSSFMARRVFEWHEAGAALSGLQVFAISVSRGFRTGWPFIAPILLFFCVGGALVCATIGKGRK
ncbi:MAG: hypothetical protein ABIJ56_00220 [Pseudomonadota bacterium]